MTTDRRTFLKQVGVGAAGVGLVGALPCGQAAPFLSRHGLPRSAPEAQGVSSAKILGFLEAVAASRHEFHSFMLLRHGHVIAEGWWSPYQAALPHALYSLSKSFTSTAVGLAVAESKLKVDDRVTSFFPNDLPDPVSENLAALRVKDLLTMSVGHAKDSTWTIVKTDNWVKSFLALPIPTGPAAPSSTIAAQPTCSPPSCSKSPAKGSSITSNLAFSSRWLFMTCPGKPARAASTPAAGD